MSSRPLHTDAGRCRTRPGAHGLRARELHGIIGRTYREEGADASCLGRPTSDEQPNGLDRLAHFQHGRIDWTPGMTRGTITCG